MVGMVMGQTSPIPKDCRQIIVGTAKGWNESHVTVRCFEKQGDSWKQVLGPYPGRLGKSGLVWGMGLTVPPKGVVGKREGDLRSPAGVFELGGAYGTVNTPQKHAKLPYRRVTPADLWVEDASSPHYNHHIILKKPASTPWELQQQMKLNDYPHSLKLFIKHNAVGDRGRPVAGAGSSIFFHIWRRDGLAATAGCTTLKEKDLRAIIAWLNPSLHPVYVLLPTAEYKQLTKSWKLPAL